MRTVNFNQPENDTIMMKLANLFRPFRRRKTPQRAAFWVRREYAPSGKRLFYTVVEDGEGDVIPSLYKGDAERYAVLLNAGLLQLPIAEATSCTELLSAVRMGELIHRDGPERYEMPPAQDEQFAPPQPVPAEQLKKDLYDGPPFPSQPHFAGRANPPQPAWGGVAPLKQMSPAEAAAARPSHVPHAALYGDHVRLIPYDGPPPGYQAMGGAIPQKSPEEVATALWDSINRNELLSGTVSGVPWGDLVPEQQLDAARLIATIRTGIAPEDLPAKEKTEPAKCERCHSTPGNGTVKVLGCGGDYEDWPCPVCRKADRVMARGY
jgi:hypothetical protein